MGGESIESISSIPTELEVLFNKDSIFKVLKNEKIVGIYHIILEQM